MSTIDVLYMVNNVLTKNETQQLALFDFSKAFGNTERDILRAKHYESGIPFNFVEAVKMGHGGNKLTPKCDGYIGASENNRGFSKDARWAIRSSSYMTNQ